MDAFEYIGYLRDVTSAPKPARLDADRAQNRCSVYSPRVRIVLGALLVTSMFGFTCGEKGADKVVGVTLRCDYRPFTTSGDFRSGTGQECAGSPTLIRNVSQEVTVKSARGDIYTVSVDSRRNVNLGDKWPP